MKKFTSLEEDLIKEALESERMFQQRLKKAKLQLKEIENNLDQMSAEFYGDSTGKKTVNWGYAGSLGYVNEKLDDIIEHLLNKEDDVDMKFDKDGKVIYSKFRK